MLNYLVQVTGDLLVAAVLVGLAFAFAERRWQALGTRCVAVGLCAGALFGLVMGIMKNTTRLIDTGLWNMRLFVAYDVLLVIFAALLVAGHLARTKAEGRDATSAQVKPSATTASSAHVESMPLDDRAAEPAPAALLAQQVPSLSRIDLATGILLGALVFCRTGYSFTDTLVYPMTFDLADGSILSTDFVFRLIGWLFGLTLVGILALALRKQAHDVELRMLGPMLAICLLLVGITQTMTCLQTMLARRLIPQNHDLFLVIKFFSNNTLLFQLVAASLALACAWVLFVVAARAHEPYSNPAEHRRIRARWRNRRRWAATTIACVVLATLNLTVINALNSREVELSPSEESEVRDGNVYVALEQVDDGHLHRFTYTTDSGVGIRFIVIKKPNASSYGIGLDACDICGETGYFERDGQVVCKLCDVVMNVNTIGFKGGCNPIVIDYSIADGYIIVPIEGLMPYETTFKS